MEELRLENEENIIEIESLKKQIQQLKISTEKYPQSRDGRRDESAESKTSHLSLDFTKKSILERQEGEVRMREKFILKISVKADFHTINLSKTQNVFFCFLCIYVFILCEIS